MKSLIRHLYFSTEIKIGLDFIRKKFPCDQQKIYPPPPAQITKLCNTLTLDLLVKLATGCPVRSVNLSAPCRVTKRSTTSLLMIWSCTSSSSCPHLTSVAIVFSFSIKGSHTHQIAWPHRQATSWKILLRYILAFSMHEKFE